MPPPAPTRPSSANRRRSEPGPRRPGHRPQTVWSTTSSTTTALIPSSTIAARHSQSAMCTAVFRVVRATMRFHAPSRTSQAGARPSLPREAKRAAAGPGCRGCHVSTTAMATAPAPASSNASTNSHFIRSIPSLCAMARSPIVPAQRRPGRRPRARAGARHLVAQGQTTPALSLGNLCRGRGGPCPPPSCRRADFQCNTVMTSRAVRAARGRGGMVSREGLEPSTPRLKVSCSTG